MATKNADPSIDEKPRPPPQMRGESGDKGTDGDDAGARNFIETHNVTRVSRKADPGSGEESADLLESEEADPAKRGT